jgi:hypothetical protein
MAMWLTKQRAQQGPVFGSADEWEGLGIFIDTYKNNRPGTVFPYVMAATGDGKTRYDKENDGKNNEAAGCSVRVFLYLEVYPLAHSWIRPVVFGTMPTSILRFALLISKISHCEWIFSIRRKMNGQNALRFLISKSLQSPILVSVLKQEN